jgi:5-methylcytosine-specific restriction enzyme A
VRELPEWVAKHDDEAIPARVKVRCFLAFHGTCAACGLVIVGKLRPAYDHLVALINGGEHRESNLQLLCTLCHAVKTKSDVAEKSQVYHKRKKAIGIRSKRRTIPGRKFNGQPIPPKWR